MRRFGFGGKASCRPSRGEGFSEAKDFLQLNTQHRRLDGKVLAAEAPPLDLGEPLPYLSLEGEILPPLDSVCGCGEHGSWCVRPTFASATPVDEVRAEAVGADCGGDQPQSASAWVDRGAATSPGSVEFGATAKPARGQPKQTEPHKSRPKRPVSERKVSAERNVSRRAGKRRAAVGFTRVVAAGGLASVVLATTVDLNLSVSAVAAWATAGRLASGEVVAFGKTVETAAIERRVARAFNELTGKITVSMADVERIDGPIVGGTADGAQNAAKPDVRKFSVPEPVAVNVHTVELAPVDQKTFPQFSDRTGRLIQPSLMQSAVYSMSTAGLGELVFPRIAAHAATAGADTVVDVKVVAEPVAIVTPGTSVPIITAVPTTAAVWTAPAPQAATSQISAQRALLVPTVIKTPNIAKIPLANTVYKSGSAPLAKAGQAAPRPVEVRDSREAAPRLQRTANAATFTSPALQGSFKDTPVRAATASRGAVLGGAVSGVMVSGGWVTGDSSEALTLTAYRGQLVASKPAFSQATAAAEDRGVETWQAVPSWAHAWLVARTEPIEVFRNSH